MINEITELISVMLEDKGYSVDFDDYGVLFVGKEDTQTGVKVTV